MQDWDLPAFLFIILYPILLFILANLLFPAQWRKKNLDMKIYYFRMYPKFFLTALALIATAVASDLIIAGRPVREQVLKVVLFIILLIMYVSKPKSSWAHSVLALFLLTVMIASLILLSDELVIR
ncbi:MAG: hypothetical protein HRU69_14790 [Flammeovirgaceae bacterium]|nr:MAG: hypothetical protein HRU69_14790 [Flammeovirgaceae bacterium]